MSNNERRRGFSFLSFLLGILIGIILVIGMVAGVVYYVLSNKIDDVMNTVGMPNKDEEGNNVYINTDKENGGVETLLELVTVLGGFVSDTDSLSVGKVEKLIPAVSGVVDGFHGMLNEYIVIDRAEFADVQFSQLGEFVQGKILDIEPAKLLNSFGMGEALDNKIISIIFNGSEAEYITDEAAGATYPAYYDVYEKRDGSAYLKSDNSVELDSALIDNLVPKNGASRLYYCTVDGKNYVADSEMKVTVPVARAASAEYTPSSSAKLSGNYYYENGNRVTVTPITLRSLSDGGFDVLNDVYLTALLDSEGNDLAFKVLDGISLGDIMNGNVDFDEVLSNLTVPEFMDVKPSNAIMCYLGYGIYSVDAANNTCILDGGVPCTFTVDGEGIITSVTTENGASVKGTSINQISGKIDGLSNKLTIGELITNITPSDKVLYALKDYTVNGLSNGINELKLGDLITIGKEDKILGSIKDSTIGELPGAISNITINTLYADEIYKVTKDADGKEISSPEDVEIKLATAYNAEYIYYKMDNGKLTIVQMGEPDAEGKYPYELGKLTKAQFDAAPAGTYYTYGKAQGIWEMLLYIDKKDGNNGTEKAYKLGNLTEMVGKVSENMQHSKLIDLHKAGLLTFPEGSLSKRVVYTDGRPETTLGELELTEALAYLASLLPS